MDFVTISPEVSSHGMLDRGDWIVKLGAVDLRPVNDLIDFNWALAAGWNRASVTGFKQALPAVGRMNIWTAAAHK